MLIHSVSYIVSPPSKSSYERNWLTNTNVKVLIFLRLNLAAFMAKICNNCSAGGLRFKNFCFIFSGLGLLNSINSSLFLENNDDMLFEINDVEKTVVFRNRKLNIKKTIGSNLAEHSNCGSSITASDFGSGEPGF